VNAEAFRTTLLRVSALLRLCPEIEAIDLDPVIVTAPDTYAVDVRVRVAVVTSSESRGRVNEAEC
jgi:hypothetical protein